MGGGGGGFVPRTEAQLAEVPAWADAAVAASAGAAAAVVVAPFLMCVDRAVVAHTAGNSPGGSLFGAIGSAAYEFMSRPRSAFGSSALWMVAGVYGATYATANLCDVLGERNRAEPVARTTVKFTATTAANMGCSIIKDAAFARMFGAAAASLAPVPTASYMLFATRDCFTIGGAFIVPGMLASSMEAAGTAEGTANTMAQLMSPPLMQVICTPLHLLALDFVNSTTATSSQRASAITRSLGAALAARSLRMLPAYGIGGLLNKSFIRLGRDTATLIFCAHHEPVHSTELPDDDIDNLLEFLHGDMHPVALASCATKC